MHPKHDSTVAHGSSPAETAPLTARSMVGLLVLFALVALVVLHPVTMLVGAVLTAVALLY